MSRRDGLRGNATRDESTGRYARRTGRYTRRAALATAGALGAALAGCLASDEAFWDDPPSFDSSGLETVTDDPLPERPSVIPVTFAADRIEAVVDRVDELLAPIPEPLTAETLPNGEIRAEIVDERAAAREARERLLEAVDRSETDALSTAAAAIDARGHAAAAAAVWAAVSVDRSAEAVPPSARDVTDRATALTDDLPAEAAGPVAGTVVYGAIEQWLDDNSVSLTGPGTNPLEAGRTAARTERADAAVDAGEHLRDRYVDSLAEPRSISDAVIGAVDALAPAVEAEFDRYYEDEDDRFGGYPNRIVEPESLLERDVTPGEPGLDLLSSKLSGVLDRARDGPLAWPGENGETDEIESYPAYTVRRTYRTLAAFEAVDALADRLDSGDDGGGDELFPADGTVVREARAAAIDAVADLGASDSPLEAWLARTLVDDLENLDETLPSAADSDSRRIANRYGEYVWIETLARSAPDATETVEGALSAD